MDDNDYRIVRLIGHGGMGIVHEVETPDGRHFALKRFNGVKKNTGFLKERFCTEARLLSRLSHPNLVKVHDAGMDVATGEPYFVMDLLLGTDGEPATLETLRKKGVVSDKDARRWFTDISSVLEYLARQGVVHRDVKLENILVDTEGHAHLSDFGVSRIFGDELKDSLAVSTTFVEGESTGTRPVMGTYFYLAPEVRAGEPATPESDLYALGVTFFRLLTGMWYEPGVNAADMLAPFGRFWREHLTKLLATEPSERKMGIAWCSCRAIPFTLAAIFAAFALLVILGMAWSRGRSSSHLPAANGNSLPSANGRAGSPLPAADNGTFLPTSLDLDGGEKMGFAACPAGTFMMSNIGNDTTCHKVTITRPFWIGRTFVTARQFGLEFPDAARDEAAKKMDAAFGDMYVVCRLQGKIVDEYFRRLNMKYGANLPRGYVFRLPTEAELEYAIREGGKRTAQPSDIWWDTRETKRLMSASGLGFREELRLLPKSGGNGWGMVSLWTDTEQAVLDTTDGERGTKTASQSIAYAEEETDPLRAGELRLSRQARLQRWLLMKEPSGFIRVCIGPRLTTSD